MSFIAINYCAHSKASTLVFEALDKSDHVFADYILVKWLNWYIYIYVCVSDLWNLLIINNSVLHLYGQKFNTTIPEEHCISQGL